MNLVNKLSAEMKNAVRVQDELYDKIVLPRLGEDDFPNAYKMYIEELGGFDVKAFRRCVDKITELKDSDPQKFANWAERFTYIGEYATHRNAFDDKVKEIRQMDGTQSEKQAIFDTLDRNRTRAHNGVISLFNNLNEMALENGIAQPYPTTHPFDPQNPIDRGNVADVLLKQETLLETTNLLLTSEKRVQSDSEKFRSMSFSEQLKAAKEYMQVIITNDDLKVEKPELTR